MKTTRVAAIGAASAFAVAALLIGVPAAMAATQTNTSIVPTPSALSVGTTITFTSTAGTWRLLASVTPVSTTTTSSSAVGTGTASGTMVLTVTGAYKGGYSLSLISGTVMFNGETYAFFSGSALMGPHQAHLVGLGTFASPASGSFLFAAGAHTNLQGHTYNTLRFDIETNGMEYGVVLLVNAQFS